MQQPAAETGQDCGHGCSCCGRRSAIIPAGSAAGRIVLHGQKPWPQRHSASITTRSGRVVIRGTPSAVHHAIHDARRFGPFRFFLGGDGLLIAGVRQTDDEVLQSLVANLSPDQERFTGDHDHDVCAAC